MKVLQDKIGNANILIQAMDYPEVVGGEKAQESPTIETGITSKDMKSAYSQIKGTLVEIANDVGKEFSVIEKAVRPHQMELEFGVGVVGEVKAGVEQVVVIGFSGQTEFTFKVTMTWNFKQVETP